jgi:alkanesulfonate monooxygenase SsuD/methylene tetrahydromethanopterin reductase-like flavin-dependent oxidoreductase (luciferase family)
VKHGVVILPERQWSSARRTWEEAEELGFDHAWTYDHLIWRWFRDLPWYATMPTLTAAATVTSRIMLGVLVANPAIRHPVSFAKELVTLDDISEGRMMCAVGAGAGGFDDDALGLPPLTPAARGHRFKEFVELIDRVLREAEVSHSGRYYEVRDARTHPRCVQRPRLPMAVAATGRGGIALAAERADIWVTAAWPGHGEPVRFDRAVSVIAKQSAELERACAAIGRDPATVRRLVVTGALIGGVLDSLSSYREAVGMFEEVGITDLVVHWPRDDFPYAGRRAVLDDIAAEFLSPAQPAFGDRLAAAASTSNPGRNEHAVSS